FLGSVQGGDTGSFTFPRQAIVPGDNVVSVLTVDMGHEEDYQEKNSNRTARGIVSAMPVGAPPSAITWRLQGERGSGWTPVELPVQAGVPGVMWYSTRVELNLPTDQDTSVGIRFRDPPGRHYRATLFINGWMMGNYISDIGPQHTFPVPNGILHPDGGNRIDIAVWKTDSSPGGLGNVELMNLG